MEKLVLRFLCFEIRRIRYVHDFPENVCPKSISNLPVLEREKEVKIKLVVIKNFILTSSVDQLPSLTHRQTVI